MWKINDNYAGGVPDAYYSGPVGDMWIEYKYVKLPKRPSSKVSIDLSELQRNWIKARADENRTVAVVVGSEKGCLLLTNTRQALPENISLAEFLSSSIDKRAIADHIEQTTCYPKTAGVPVDTRHEDHCDASSRNANGETGRRQPEAVV